VDVKVGDPTSHFFDASKKAHHVRYDGHACEHFGNVYVSEDLKMMRRFQSARDRCTIATP
jgi:hypothetical protein